MTEYFGKSCIVALSKAKAKYHHNLAEWPFAARFFTTAGGANTILII
jgi:hypothetical protein